MKFGSISANFHTEKTVFTIYLKFYFVMVTQNYTELKYSH